MTSILTQYPCWPNAHLLEPSERLLALRVDHLPITHSSSSTSSPASSTSTSPRSSESVSASPNELAAPLLLPPEHIPFAASITPAQLYALQELRNAGLYQQHMMLHQLAGPVPGLGAQQPMAYMPNFAALAAGSINGMMGQASGMLSGNSAASAEALFELPEVSQRIKRKRLERLSTASEDRMDGEDSDSESQYDRFRSKQAKLSADAVPESDLSDITSLLSLPQKEAAQRLGISESMLCKRFKECTRRKWPFRLLRKIEKTISTLEAQQILEPLSLEDQDKLEELRKQRVECLAPVKIRITRSPSPVPSARSTLSMDSDSSAPTAEEDSDSDDSDTRETDFEMEAIEKLIHLSRATSPRSPPTTGFFF